MISLQTPRNVSNLCIIILILMSLLGCGDEDAGELKVTDPSLSLTIYKSETCGCCGDWVDHVNAQGFATLVENTDDLPSIKAKFNIGEQVRSCHTAVTPEGFVFEGHIPARYVKQFLKSPPNGAYGLTVPGMPVGSPGMEFEDKFMPYKILQLNRDGTNTIYAEVQSKDMQL